MSNEAKCGPCTDGAPCGEHLKAACELLDAADTSDYEECDACNAVLDICPIHRAGMAGSQQITELLQFILEDPEWAWHGMQNIKKQRVKTAASTEARDEETPND